MANEKLMILKMLEEGKITAEEAARLMEASTSPDMASKTSTPAGPASPSMGAPHTYDSYTPPKDMGSSVPKDSGSPIPNSNGPGAPRSSYSPPPASSGHSYTQQGPAGSGLDSFASDLEKKFDTLAKDMEPKIQRFTETIVEKTANVADMISKSLTAPPPRTDRPYGGTAPAGGYPGNVIERQFEMPVAPGYSELNMSGLNGNVLVNGYNGDKITAKISYRAKYNGANIELMKLGDKYYLNYDEDNFDYVAIDAFVPETMFNNIKIQTTNAKIFITTISTNYLTISNLNGNTELRTVTADNLALDTNNGMVDLWGIRGRNAKIDSFNGNVAVTSIDVENLQLSALNGSVNMNVDYFNIFNSYTWVLEASNGKFVMNLPSTPSLGYYLKAQTSLEKVKVGLTGLSYMINNPSFIEAKSIEYDRAEKIVKISVETSNAPLNIN